MIINPYRFAAAGGGSDPDYSSVGLLLHCDGANNSTTFTDNSGTPKTVTAQADAKISTTSPKFGTGSCSLDGTGDYLLVTGNTAFDYTGDFCWEAWVYLTSGTNSGFFGSGLGSLYYGVYSNCIIVGNGGINPFLNVTSFTPYLNAWTHVACTRSGSTMRHFINGDLKETATSSASFNGGGGNVHVGYSSSLGYITGKMDDVRLTKGVARYTASFTAPTAAFPNS